MFKIKESSLSARNWVIDVQTIHPDNTETWNYWVLHNGICNIPMLFRSDGDYFLNMSVEDALYSYSDDITVLPATGKQNGTSSSGNVTWTTIKSNNLYTVNLYAEGSGFVQSGSIRVVSPDATMVDVPIISGSASVLVEDRGQYQLQYEMNDQLFLKYIEYNPVVSLVATAFSDSGQTSVTLKIDGEYPT